VKNKKNVVCGEGNPNAKLLIVAQTPGAKEKIISII
jgi:uracil-DNA glycosylase